MSSRFERLIGIDHAIRRGEYPSLAYFVSRFEVKERTIYDDLEFMKLRLGAPIKRDRRRGGYYYADPTWVLPSMLATEGELLAFFLSVELARRYLGTTFETALREAVKKLAQSLPAQLQIDLGQLASHYTFSAGATSSANPHLLLALDRAIRERRPLLVTYYTPSRNALTERTLHPYHLHNVRGDWQLIAFDSYREKVRTFAVERIRSWSVQQAQHFAWLEGFSLDAYLASQFITERVDDPVEIAVWFDPYQARYVRERHWHVTQQPLEEHADGSLTLRFTAGSLDEVKRWVLGFGHHARVLAPAELRALVVADLEAALKNYQESQIETLDSDHY